MEDKIKTLLKYRGKRVVVNIKSVSRSGMTRKMDFYVLYKNDLVRINGAIEDIAGYKLDKNGAVIVGGCGMDMVFSVLSNFNYAISTKINKKMTKNYSTFFFNADHYKLL